MNIARQFNESPSAIKCIDMHTSGEPARIVYSGYPPMPGLTLLEQRAEAKVKHDHIRQRIMLEPRGHRDMYGAIIRADTELVRQGKAHVGVLYCHNSGYSTMCGHATIALGRFLVDVDDRDVFPARDQLQVDEQSQTVQILLHAPCGVVTLTVPLSPGGRKSDPNRFVSFNSTPSYPVATDLTLPIAQSLRWPQLLEAGKDRVTLDIAYGGSYHVIVPAVELGFAHSLQDVNLEEARLAVKRLVSAISSERGVADAFGVYAVMVTDTKSGDGKPSKDGRELGLCFFGDDQIDRSPTGSCVAARMALAHAKGVRGVGQRWTYDSLVTRYFETGAFRGEIVEEVPLENRQSEPRIGVIVKVEGQASFIGCATFIAEGDNISSEAFLLERITGR